MKSIPLNVINDVLIGLKDGLSYRQIQQLYGTSKSTVTRLSERLCQAGLTAQEVLSLDEIERQTLFHPPREKTLIEPDWAKVHQKLQQKKGYPTIDVRRLRATRSGTWRQLHLLIILPPVQRLETNEWHQFIVWQC